MTDARRKAAEEWCEEIKREDAKDPAPELNYWLARYGAHLAGQECGEQRAVEGIVRWLRNLAHAMARNIGRSDESIAKLFLAARSIERGEWKEGK